jgi:hypothetical protein
MSREGQHLEDRIYDLKEYATTTVSALRYAVVLIGSWNTTGSPDLFAFSHLNALLSTMTEGAGGSASNFEWANAMLTEIEGAMWQANEWGIFDESMWNFGENRKGKWHDLKRYALLSINALRRALAVIEGWSSTGYPNLVEAHRLIADLDHLSEMFYEIGLFSLDEVAPILSLVKNAMRDGTKWDICESGIKRITIATIAGEVDLEPRSLLSEAACNVQSSRKMALIMEQRRKKGNAGWIRMRGRGQSSKEGVDPA